MKICVIGGSGFIGTRLCDRFTRENIEFDIVDIRDSARYSNRRKSGDVRSLVDMESSIDGDCIVNLAAVHRDDVRPLSLYDEVNVEGAKNICEAAEIKKIQSIIFTSSVAIFGFANPNTGEDGNIQPYNDYGRTKWEAEAVFKDWQSKDTENRSLVIVRPTVVFGEGNRGNVYNLVRQIASGIFLMIGNGKNIKSMAYVENIAGFLQFGLDFGPGVHIYNYVDKPDWSVGELVEIVRETLGKKGKSIIVVPKIIGLALGYFADFVSWSTGKSLPVSSVRVKKFCATTQFESAVSESGFVPPVSMTDAMRRTLKYELIDEITDRQIFTIE